MISVIKSEDHQSRKPILFSTVPKFISCFREKDEKLQYFLCELYFHNFILEEKREDNPSPFIGDI
jgi:hypothetical protein